MPDRSTSEARKPAQSYSPITERGDDSTGVFCIGSPDVGEALPVFGFKEEARISLAPGRLKREWRAGKTTAGEPVSLLCGPGRGIGPIALDPAAGSDAETLLQPVNVGRRRLAGALSGAGPGSGCSMPEAGGGRPVRTTWWRARTFERRPGAARTSQDWREAGAGTGYVARVGKRG